MIAAAFYVCLIGMALSPLLIALCCMALGMHNTEREPT